ncbi:MAG: YrdB family protein [Thermomicrobiales bacterium]|nr:YrdB family protein [Thermomicrobiales bacterium]
MSTNPDEDTTRQPIRFPDVVMFLLELAMWASFAIIGWQVGDGVTRWIFAIVFALGAMLIWGLFRTPGMPPAAKPGVIPTSGPVRLILEIGLFLLAGYGLWVTGSRWAAETLWTFAALNYVLSFSRIRWLLDHDHRGNHRHDIARH